ncbi:MAG TPA: hypothetical protein VK098_09885 [Beutenbergiaceae bacterium]|nr:hypothetical protein [Beutenbergiaceae bacterium]
MVSQRTAGIAIATTVAAIVIGSCSGGDVVNSTGEQVSPPATTAAPEPESAEPDPETPESSKEERTEVDPTLAGELAELIREEVPPLDLYASNDIETDCENDVSGCYKHDEQAIYLDGTITDFRRPELLAHEYLHFVWERDDLEEDEALLEALQDAFLDSEGLGALIPAWQESYFQDDGTVVPTELFSYACTGLRSEQLPPVVSGHCEAYLDTSVLPINETINESDLVTEINSLRSEDGVAALEINSHAASASQARADLFTPYAQVPLDEYPESVRTHLDAGCASAKYGAMLTRPHDLAEIARSIDRLLDRSLTSSSYTGIGIAVNEYDYIDASELFDDRTVKVNTTLVVTTICE